MLSVDCQKRLQDLDCQLLNKVLHSCADILCGRNSMKYEAFKETTDWTAEEYGCICNEVKKLFSEVVGNSLGNEMNPASRWRRTETIVGIAICVNCIFEFPQYFTFAYHVPEICRFINLCRKYFQASRGTYKIGILHSNIRLQLQTPILTPSIFIVVFACIGMYQH